MESNEIANGLILIGNLLNHTVQGLGGVNGVDGGGGGGGAKGVLGGGGL